MKKRILTVLLAVCLVFALGTVTALADGSETFANELPTAKDGIITLDKDVVLSKPADIEKDTVLNLGNFSITASEDWSGGDYLIGVKRGATLTINGGSEGSIDAGEIYCAVKLTLTGENVDTKAAGLVVNGGNLTGYYYGIAGNGTRHNTVITINGGNITGTNGTGIYHPQDGKLTIRGGNITGQDTAVEIRSGTLNISNGTFTSKATSYEVKENGSGTTVSGAAIAVSQHTTKKNISVTITGGTFNGVYAFTETNVQSGSQIENVTVKISDGTFNGKVSSDDCTGFITGGRFKDTTDDGFKDCLAPGLDVDDSGKVVVGSNAVAQFGDKYFENLQDAITAAGAGETVYILKNIEVDGSALTNNNGVITIDNKNIILNGKDHKITVKGVTGTNGNTPSAINIQNGANVTVKNLTIDSNGAKHGLNINNNATVKLEDVEIMNSDWYAVVCNSSKLTVDGLYTHGNEWGINIDSKTANVKSDVTITDAYITESDSIVFENTKGAGSEVEINGGTFNVIKRQNANQNNVIIDVNGGTFGTSIVTIADTYPNYQVEVGGDYSYYNNADDALDAAGTTGEVTYVGRTTNTHDVTLYYGKGHVVELEVADDEVIYLPSGSFNGKPIAGWTERYDGDYKPGAKVVVDRNMYFTVVLKDGEFDIVIDSKIEHGDISTNVNSADKGDTVYIYVDPDTGYVLDDIDVYYGLNYRYSVKVSYVRNNTYRFEMPNADVYITATFKANGMPFVDVHRTQWFYDSIYYVWSNDMMEGDSATTFNPDGTMTRAMFWAVLGRMDGQTITGTNWVEQARNWAMREGVSDGTNPNDYVTREQMVTMLWRYAGEKNGSANLNRYTDSGSVSGYAVEAMRWAIGTGVIQGVTSTTLAPKANATRAECATIFMRFDKM